MSEFFFLSFQENQRFMFYASFSATSQRARIVSWMMWVKKVKAEPKKSAREFEGQKWKRLRNQQRLGKKV